MTAIMAATGIANDPRETTNLYDRHPDVVERLEARLSSIQGGN